eukprot:358810-Chlamydomonas_euryale.AAC.4
MESVMPTGLDEAARPARISGTQAALANPTPPQPLTETTRDCRWHTCVKTQHRVVHIHSCKRRCAWWNVG